MDEARARELLQRERERIETELRGVQASEGDELSNDDDELGDLATDTFQAELDETRRDGIHSDQAPGRRHLGYGRACEWDHDRRPAITPHLQDVACAEIMDSRDGAYFRPALVTNGKADKVGVIKLLLFQIGRQASDEFAYRGRILEAE